MNDEIDPFFEFRCVKCEKNLKFYEINYLGANPCRCKVWCDFCFVGIERWLGLERRRSCNLVDLMKKEFRRLVDLKRKQWREEEAKKIENRIASNRKRTQTRIRKRLENLGVNHSKIKQPSLFSSEMKEAKN